MRNVGVVLIGAGLLLWWQQSSAAASPTPSLPGYGGNAGYGGYSGYSVGNGYGYNGVQDVINSPADILARTIYGEARGESDAGKQAVASVILNRVNAGFPDGTIQGVCQWPNQFSCWNHNDVNYPKITSVTMADPSFATCYAIALQAVAGDLPDNTGGATMYHDTSIGTPASWGPVQQTARIGRLIFFT